MTRTTDAVNTLIEAATEALDQRIQLQVQKMLRPLAAALRELAAALESATMRVETTPSLQIVRVGERVAFNLGRVVREGKVVRVSNHDVAIRSGGRIVHRDVRKVHAPETLKNVA